MRRGDFRMMGNRLQTLGARRAGHLRVALARQSEQRRSLMSDPPRLLEDSSEELSDSVRRLLLVGIEATPPSELGAQVWAGLSAKLPASGSPVGSPQGAGGAGLQGAHLGGLLVKAVLAAVTLGALVFGVRALRVFDQPAPVAPKLTFTVAPPGPQVPAAAVEVAAPQAAALEAAPAAPSALPVHAANAVRSSKLAAAHAPVVAPAEPAEPSDASEESRMVAAARDALRAGNSAGALSLLGQAQQRFGGGVLGQEREALTIEALSKSGQRAAAQARGQAFLKNYTNSPYSARIRSIVGAN